MTDAVKERLRSTQLEILDEIVRICRENGLRYHLTAGTCLGAVRHKGFIPWDDDIDIAMPRADFQRFTEITASGDTGDFFLDWYTTNPSYGRPFAKYCKKNTLFIEANGLKQSIYIDIFAQDKVPGPEYVAKSIYPRISHYLGALTTMRREGMRGRDLKSRIVYCLTRPIPVRRLFLWEIRLMSRFEETDAGYYLNYGSQYDLVKETLPIATFEPYSMLEFEGKLYNVPRDWDLYLRQVYGDYMTLPPEEKRKTHYPQTICFDTAQQNGA